MKFVVENMTCGHCVRTITRIVQSIYPLARINVDLAASTVLIEGPVDAAQVIAVLASEGYPTRVQDSEPTPTPKTCCGSCDS